MQTAIAYPPEVLHTDVGHETKPQGPAAAYTCCLVNVSSHPRFLSPSQPEQPPLILASILGLAGIQANKETTSLLPPLFKALYRSPLVHDASSAPADFLLVVPWPITGQTQGFFFLL